MFFKFQYNYFFYLIFIVKNILKKYFYYLIFKSNKLDFFIYIFGFFLNNTNYNNIQIKSSKLKQDQINKLKEIKINKK